MLVVLLRKPCQKILNPMKMWGIYASQRNAVLATAEDGDDNSEEDAQNLSGCCYCCCFTKESNWVTCGTKSWGHRVAIGYMCHQESLVVISFRTIDSSVRLKCVLSHTTPPVRLDHLYMFFVCSDLPVYLCISSDGNHTRSI